MLCKISQTVLCAQYTPEHLLTGVRASSKAKDLKELASLGHFLKGSSATLGLTKVKESCEKIQHYGNNKDEDGTTEEKDDDKCIERIKKTLKTVKEEYAEAEKILRRFYAS